MNHEIGTTSLALNLDRAKWNLGVWPIRLEHEQGR
jgi:hypothetical protein